jgi:hypothetical protein
VRPPNISAPHELGYHWGYRLNTRYDCCEKRGGGRKALTVGIAYGLLARPIIGSIAGDLALCIALGLAPARKAA